jgi:thioredoxin-like negative regulator of GroEL
MIPRSTAALAIGLALIAGPASAGDVTTNLQSAMETARESGRPVLLKVGTEWCTACNAFDTAVAGNAAFRGAIADAAILVRVDAEKGAGVELAKRYGVKGYPTFLLTNAEGQILDRWMGFGETTEFAETLASATDDPMTVDERIAHFASDPSEADALKIGDLRLAEGLCAEANAYYRRAAALNPDADHSARIFLAVAYGLKRSVYTTNEVREQADAVFASSETSDEDIMKVLHTMRGIARHSGDMAMYTPYLETAYARTADAEGWVAEAREKMAADHALYVENDAERAIEIKKASMPEDWTEDSQALNAFAWWCFENKVDLEEAEQLARRGVELAEPGVQKALVLDTLAELCNVNGSCGESLELIRMAIAEDPDNDYYARQAERFAELLAQQSE